jgi:hypothetical protein
MPFKLRQWEFNIIVAASVCSLALCIFSAVSFNLERHKLDDLTCTTNATNYNTMVNSIQELNIATMSQADYIAQTNAIFANYSAGLQQDYNDFEDTKSSSSYRLYTASRAVAYTINAVLAFPVMYMFFTASHNIGQNFRAKRKNIIYYRMYWLGIIMFFVGLGLLAGSFYAYGKEDTQIGVGLFIAGELIIIAGCYFLREYVPDRLPDGYVESDEDLEGQRQGGRQEGHFGVTPQPQYGEPSAPTTYSRQ